MYPTDAHRDAVIESYRSPSLRDEMNFTQWMLDVSAVLHAVEPEDVIQIKIEWTFDDTLFQDVLAIDTVLIRLCHEVYNWFESIDAADLEPLCSKYSSHRYPTLRAIFLEKLLPKVYALLKYKWSVSPKRLDMTFIQALGQRLINLLYGYNWPDSYFFAKDTCAVCLDTMYISRYTTECLHGFHPICLMTWLQHHNTCPTCRTKIIQY